MGAKAKEMETRAGVLQIFAINLLHAAISNAVWIVDSGQLVAF
jgi:hypothetical protein